MSKFKIKLKLQGLELEVEGSREDVPVMVHHVGEQFAGLLHPAAEIVVGEPAHDGGRDVQRQVQHVEPVVGGDGKPASRKKKRSASGGRKRSASGSPAGLAIGEEHIIDWKHDAGKWGSPAQSWKTLDKAIWLLYVASKETEFTELTHLQIAGTFNQHFRQAGTIRAHNVKRDLGYAKNPDRGSLVGEDSTKDPSTWFLTDAGNKRGAELVRTARAGLTTATTSAPAV